MTLEQKYNLILELLNIEQSTIDIITGINGYNHKTFDDITYYLTGYHTLEDYLIDIDYDFNY